MGRTVVRFDGFEVDLRAGELRKGNVNVRLQEQPLQILTMLLDRAGDVVTRDELKTRLWPDGTSVDFEHSVNAAIKRLRTALGDTADHPRYVETLHRRGYRFVAPIDLDGARDQAWRAAGVLSPANGRPRLVVLPFKNLSGDPAQDYFGEGMTEEIIAQLGQRSARHLGVIARASATSLRDSGRSARDIGQCLRADYLIDGSVRRERDRVRITVQLVETGGETHLWAESYDRELVDCLTIQAEVASQVADALALELLPERSARSGRTRHPGAYQAYLKGRFHWNTPGDTGVERAIAYYDEALSLDPGFAAAYSARARAWVTVSDYHRQPPRLALAAARESAGRALAIDPTEYEAHVALAEVQRVLDWDAAAATTSYRAALAVNPDHDATQRYFALFLAARGRGSEALAMADRACELDPLCLTLNTGAAAVRFFGGDFEGALERCRHTLDMEPSFVQAGRLMSAALVQLGRVRDAVDAIERLPRSRMNPVSLAWMGHALATGGHESRARDVLGRLRRMEKDQYVPAYHVALVHAALGDVDLAMASLERACEQRDPWLDTVGVDPRFAMLDQDPRFPALRARILGEA